MKGIAIQTELAEGLETIATDEGALVEGVVAPNASIAGLTLGEINFRQRFRMVVVAIVKAPISESAFLICVSKLETRYL